MEAVRYGVYPQNHKSYSLDVVPVFPATGIPSVNLQAVPVPDVTTLSIASVKRAAVDSFKTVRVVGVVLSNKMRPFLSTTCE